MARLFREQAIAAYRTPESRGGLLAVPPPSGRLLAWTLLGLLMICGGLAGAISVAVTAEGRGVVRVSGGTVQIASPVSGSVTSVRVREGDSVEAGAVLFSVEAHYVVAPRPGRIDRIDVTVGDSVAAQGSPVVDLVPTDVDLVGVAVLPARYRARLRAGDGVRLRFDEHVGAGEGVAAIERVADDLLDEQRARALFGTSVTLTAPSVLVTLRLDRMPPRAAAEFRHGMPFAVFATLERRSALSLLLPEGALR